MINKTVFTDQQLSSIILWLEKWDIPVKYSYITQHGAKAREKVEKQRIQKWQPYADSLLLEKSINIYLQELWKPSTVAIFDFGCGTWQTVIQTIKNLTQQWIQIKYHAFDISQNIVNMCQKNITKHTDCDFSYSIIDFETYNLIDILSQTRSIYKNIPVLWLLLWNTVGNFSSMERLITNILEWFRIQDRLCIGIERADIYNKKRYNNMLKTYNHSDSLNVMSATISELWIHINQCIYEATFNEKSSSIEWFVTMNQEINLNIWGTSFKLNKWDTIRIWQSRKIDETTFSKLFLDLDLRIANLRTNESNTYIQALVWPKKF